MFFVLFSFIFKFSIQNLTLLYQQIFDILVCYVKIKQNMLKTFVFLILCEIRFLSQYSFLYGGFEKEKKRGKQIGFQPLTFEQFAGICVRTTNVTPRKIFRHI